MLLQLELTINRLEHGLKIRIIYQDDSFRYKSYVIPNSGKILIDYNPSPRSDPSRFIIKSYYDPKINIRDGIKYLYVKGLGDSDTTDYYRFKTANDLDEYIDLLGRAVLVLNDADDKYNLEKQDETYIFIKSVY